MDDFESLVQIALSHGMSKSAAVGWAMRVIEGKTTNEVPQINGRYVPLRHFLRELRDRHEDPNR